ncbi:MAG TPA: GNAT family N-acetyltransferase [Acidobacteriaceae bacterium]|nr:GNAT family N-acetyltransferase [Acidobacteriaceae bacterium]
MTPEFTIREAESGDAAGILDCLGEAFALYRGQYSEGAYADTVLTEETLKQRMREMTVLVAIAPDGTVAGTIALSGELGEDGHLRGMAVRAVWQGRGIAARLLDEAESRLRARGCRRVTLDTTEPLTRAIAFYGKHGYEPTGRSQDFFGMRLLEYAKGLS